MILERATSGHYSPGTLTYLKGAIGDRNLTTLVILWRLMAISRQAVPCASFLSCIAVDQREPCFTVEFEAYMISIYSQLIRPWKSAITSADSMSSQLCLIPKISCLQTPSWILKSGVLGFTTRTGVLLPQFRILLTILMLKLWLRESNVCATNSWRREGHLFTPKILFLIRRRVS